MKQANWNAPMFRNVSIHKVGSQYLVQGSRCFYDLKGDCTVYPPETFLTTSDKERANHKYDLLHISAAL